MRPCFQAARPFALAARGQRRRARTADQLAPIGCAARGGPGRQGQAGGHGHHRAQRLFLPASEVGGEHTEVIAVAGGSDPAGLDHGGARMRAQLEARGRAGRPQLLLATSAVGAGIAAEVDGAGAYLGGQRHRFAHHVASTHDQSRSQAAQRRVEVAQGVDEERQPVGAGEVVAEYAVVEHGQGDDVLGLLGGRGQGGRVVHPQVAGDSTRATDTEALPVEVAGHGLGRAPARVERALDGGRVPVVAAHVEPRVQTYRLLGGERRALLGLAVGNLVRAQVTPAVHARPEPTPELVAHVAVEARTEGLSLSAREPTGAAKTMGRSWGRRKGSDTVQLRPPGRTMARAGSGTGRGRPGREPGDPRDRRSGRPGSPGRG